MGCHSKTKLVTVLTGSQQTTPVETLALGAGKFTLSENQKTLCYEIYFKNLSSVVQNVGDVGFAHLHNAPAGQNGPVVKPLEFCLSADMKSGVAKGKWSASETDFPLTEDLVQELLAGNIYVNIHTENWPAGEIRGQVVKLYRK